MAHRTHLVLLLALVAPLAPGCGDDASDTNGSTSGASGANGTAGTSAGGTSAGGAAGDDSGGAGGDAGTHAGGSNTGGTSAGGAAGANGSSAGGTSSGGSSGSNGASGANGSSGSNGSSGANGANGTSGASGASGLGGPFGYGINLGHHNTNWTDAQDATLAAQAGCTSNRPKLPEYFLDQWGYDIETADMANYTSLGLTHMVAFIGGASAIHSTKPSDKPDWQLDYYIPLHLYEPITLDDGSINPDNYWANYVYKMVQVYKPWIKVWEVWNEPDWTDSYDTTLTWDTQPPTKAQLPRFNGSIYDYVRMLRVTSIAAKKADPDAKIATGGLGYSSFLSALLRYTDNPDGGAVTTDFPQKGGAYFDVMSFHYYPLYTPGSSAEGVQGFLALRSEMEAKLTAAGVTGKSFVATETGAPHVSIANTPSGTQYARSYLLKVLLEAQAAGMLGVQWFTLSDDGGEPGNPYGAMGLYNDTASLGSIDQAQLTSNGYAHKTLGSVLGGALYDPAATATLTMPAGTRGLVFQTTSGKRAWALWSTASSDAPTTMTTMSLPTSVAVRQYSWGSDDHEVTQDLSPSNGAVMIDLTTEPKLLVEP